MAEIQPKIVGLTETRVDDGRELYDFFIVDGEYVEKAYKSIRDRLIITNKRLIIIDIQGVIGRKKEYMVIPYSKISAFSCESAGTFDIDSEFKVWVSGVGCIEFGFIKSNVKPLVQILSKYTI